MSELQFNVRTLTFHSASLLDFILHTYSLKFNILKELTQ